MKLNLKSTGRVFYGLGIIGIGILHFIFPGFRPVILPIPPEATAHLGAVIYFAGLVFVLLGSAITVGKRAETAAEILGIIFLLFFLMGHLPNRLSGNITFLAGWTDGLKLLALAGGAFVVARAFPESSQSKFNQAVSVITPFGKYFLAIMLVVFGIDHFVYVVFVRTLVPAWVPFDLFWTYFAGVALIGSGLAIFINFRIRTISLLLGIMLLLWLVMLHIPRALTITGDSGNEIISVLECLAFSGVAFLLYFTESSSAHAKTS